MRFHPSFFRAGQFLRPLAAGTLLLAAVPLQAQIEPAAQELAKASAAKIGAARTIQLQARHTIDPALGVGAKIEKGPIQISLQRPNRFYVIQPAGDETREMAYDGQSFCLIQPYLKQHALEPLRASSIDDFANRVDERFGFRPPVAELLSTDLAAQLFLNVTSARVVGRERVGWTRCQHLRFEQPGMTGDVWIGEKDKLPRRYRLTFNNVAGHPAWDIRFTKWQLDAPVDGALFSKRPPADSQKLTMLKSQ